jgi:glycosyltransferase involved in cell wall biosynthesis
MQKTILLLVNNLLVSTQRFIPDEVNGYKRYTAKYPVLLSKKRNRLSLLRRELYKWTGIAPAFHKALEQLNPALIHAHFADTAPSALLMAKRLSIPFLLHLRGGLELWPDSHIIKNPSFHPSLYYRRDAWKNASCFICVSEFIKRKAVEAGYPSDKCVVIYTGINVDEYLPQSPDDDSGRDNNMVIHVGRLTPYKGADHVVRAMQIVRRSNPKAHLVIIGDGEMRHRVSEMAREMSVPCRMLGAQPASVVREWLKRARVFCGPSHTMSYGMAEACGNVFREAQASGVPPVAYSHGGIPELIVQGETGLLSAEGNVQLLSENIARYLNDHTFWKRCSIAGIKHARDTFDVSRCSSEIETLYDDILSNWSEGKRGYSRNH